MKKIAALTLALIMCLGLAACGDTGSSGGDTTSKAADSAKSEE